MKKEEFISYLEGIENMLEVAGLEKLEGVIAEIKDKASTIEVNITNYPYYSWPYRPWRPFDVWYNTGVNTAGELIGKAENLVDQTFQATNEALQNATGWSVKKLDNGDFEIVKDEVDNSGGQGV